MSNAGAEYIKSPTGLLKVAEFVSNFTFLCCSYCGTGYFVGLKKVEATIITSKQATGKNFPLSLQRRAWIVRMFALVTSPVFRFISKQYEAIRSTQASRMTVPTLSLVTYGLVLLDCCTLLRYMNLKHSASSEMQAFGRFTCLCKHCFHLRINYSCLGKWTQSWILLLLLLLLLPPPYYHRFHYYYYH